MRNLVGCLVVLGFLVAGLLAQGQKPPPPAQPPTAPTRGTPNPTAPRPPQQQQPRTIFLTGVVQYADGSPVSSPVLVELRCGGNTRAQVWSSTGGQFSFQLGGNRELRTFDVSVSGGSFASAADDPFGDPSGLGLDPFSHRDRTRPLNLSACEIRLAQGQYQARPIRLGLRSALDSPDVGVLLIERQEGVEGNLVSVKTLAAPKKAKRAFEKANRILSGKQPKLDKGESLLRLAVELYPEFSAAWYLMGKVRASREDWAGAREAFHFAIEHDPLFLPPQQALGQLELVEKQWSAAAACFERVLELNPHDTQSRFSSGLAYYYAGKLDQAHTAFQAVMNSSQAAQYPGLHYALGLVLARQGKVVEAAAELRKHLERFPKSQVAERIQLQLQEWQRVGLIQP